jgi:prepilin-type N-terminal cleavage/methylation domain-containing protein
MKRMNKKGFTLVELLAVIVILAILMAIAATNIGPVIDNSRRSSMRTTAQQIIDAVRLQLTSNYELFPGAYCFTPSILDSGGVSAPFGGEYAYCSSGTGEKIGSGVYHDGSNYATKTTSSASECASSDHSYVIVARDEDTYSWSICLTTTDLEGGYLYATRQQLDAKDLKEGEQIFFGRAAISNAE